MRSGSASQLTLFRSRLDTLPLFKAALAEAMKKSRLSRAELADKANQLMQAEGLKGDITETKLNKWASPSDRTHKPSLDQLPFLLAALGDPSPAEALLAPLGVALAGERERRLIQWAEAEMDQERARKQKRRAKEALKEMGV